MEAGLVGVRRVTLPVVWSLGEVRDLVVDRLVLQASARHLVYCSALPFIAVLNKMLYDFVDVGRDGNVIASDDVATDEAVVPGILDGLSLGR